MIFCLFIPYEPGECRQKKKHNWIEKEAGLLIFSSADPQSFSRNAMGS